MYLDNIDFVSAFGQRSCVSFSFSMTRLGPFMNIFSCPVATSGINRSFSNKKRVSFGAIG